jgi:hypothetical protein
MPKITIFNCPPRAGKDVVRKFLQENFNFHGGEFKDTLFDIAFSVSRVPKDVWFERYNTSYTGVDGITVNMKDVPWDRLNGMSQRQFLIKISEEWVKPAFGKNWFGKALAFDISEEVAHEVVNLNFAISDGGFNEEIAPLIDVFGEENVRIFQWTRNGVTFESVGDSRRFITDYPKITKRLEDNNGDNVAEFASYVYDCIVQEFAV